MEEKKIYIMTKEECNKEDDFYIRKSLEEFKVEGDIEYLPGNWISTKISKHLPDAVRDTRGAFISTGLDCEIMLVEGAKEVKYPVETITKKELLKPEIEYETSIFDLEEFYSKNMDGAAIVITKDKTISAYSWIDHGMTVLNIYNYLYNHDPKESDWNGPIWQYEALEKDNIIIQLCDRCSTPIWLPTKINDYQYNALINLVEHLQQIDEKESYGIEVALENNCNEVPIRDAKEEINNLCRKREIYNVPKTK